MNEHKRQNGITIEKAREILGPDFAYLSNTQLHEMIEELYFLANASFDTV